MPLVAVVGGGAIGLSCAYALARRKIRTLLITESRPGEASPAAAGMLAPRVERTDGAAHAFALAARDRYPDWIAALREQTGIDVGLLRSGILELAPDEDGAAALQRRDGGGSDWLGAEDLASLEPALAGAPGALLHRDDGAVDNIALLEALRQALLAAHPVRFIDGAVIRIQPAGLHPAVFTSSARFEVTHIVLAAGAWLPSVEGIPRPLPVEPVRGQMILLDGAPVSHVVYGPGAYIVPRNGSTLAGSTMEHVGFEVGTTDDALERIRRAATSFAPPLGALPVRRSWSGLRPVTPDFMPILCQDPRHPRLIYACGHSRNGILMAPLTGEIVAELVAGEEPSHDIAPFSVERFGTSRA